MTCLSVVTITCNDHEGLKSTCESLDLEILEWIVVDASTNSQIKEANKQLLSSKKVKLIQERDLGRFDGMNKGSQIASGDLLCFLNGGDIFADRKIPRLLIEDYEKNRWSWAIGGTQAVDINGKVLWTWPMPKTRSLKLALGVNSYCHQATFYARSFFDTFGKYDIDSLYSDWILSLRMLKLAKPNILEFQTTKFLVDGISSQQTIQYWKEESHRLRMKHSTLIFCNKGVDKLLQFLAAKFISTTRGRLIRPDLVEKYSK